MRAIHKIERSPFHIKCKLNGHTVKLELDTGSSISIITENTINRIKSAVVHETRQKAIDYGNNAIAFIGETTLAINVEGTIKSHTFLVVKDDLSSLFGRDLCEKFNISVNMPTELASIRTVTKCSVFEKFWDFLSPNFKSDVKIRVNIKVDSDCKPLFFKPRSVPFRYRCLVKEELANLENAGIIKRLDHSDWACPVVAVLKPTGKIRLCGNYALTINKFTKTITYPMPTLDYVLGNIGDAKVFSRIDLQNAYLQLPLDEESKKYTVINTSEGLFQYNYLPFGISSASAIFQCFISQVLSGVPNTICYMDDVLVLTKTQNEHLDALDKVFTALQGAGVKLNSGKSCYFTSSVEYLGHVLSNEGARPNPLKVQAILEAPCPSNVKEVQSFVGLCTYYSRFIPNFSSAFAPLYALLKKDAKFAWDKKHQACFEIIKDLFRGTKILKLFDPNLETAIETDASNYGIAAVLLQKHNEAFMPVQFASKTLTSAQKNYATIDKEALAVMFGIERFREYLLGGKFQIRTDHKPLVKLLGRENAMPVNCSARLQRWNLRLSQYNYTIIHIPGESNYISDCLSRLPLAESKDDLEPTELVLLLRDLETHNVSAKEISVETQKDPMLTKIKHYIMHGFPTTVDETVRPFWKVKENLSLYNNCIMYGCRVVVPQRYRRKVLEILHVNHPGMSAMKGTARSLVWYPKIDDDIDNFIKSCSKCMANARIPKQTSKSEWPRPINKWSRLHIDHCFFQNEIILVVVCALTRYIEAEVVKSVNSKATIEMLDTIFSRNGLPSSIVSDNSSSFTSEEFQNYLAQKAIEHVKPAPYHPSSNGQAERSVGIIKNAMKKATGTVKERLRHVLLHYRNTPHSVTGVAPAVSLNGRVYVTEKERINPRYAPEKLHKKPVDITVFQVGDHVHALNLRQGPKWLAGFVKEKIGINMYKIYITRLDVVWTRHVEQLLPGNTQPRDDENKGNIYLEECLKDSLRKESELRERMQNENASGNVSVSDRNDCGDESRQRMPDTPIIQNESLQEIPNTEQPRRSGRQRRPVDRYVAGDKSYIAW